MHTLVAFGLERGRETRDLVTSVGAALLLLSATDPGLSGGAGIKRVYAQYKDVVGNVSDPVSDAITYRP